MKIFFADGNRQIEFYHKFTKMVVFYLFCKTRFYDILVTMKKKKKFLGKTVALTLILSLVICQVSETAWAASLGKVSLTAKQSTQTSISLSWGKISGADGYRVYRATAKNGTYKMIKSISGNKNTSYKNTGLTVGKTYYYKVRAYETTKSGRRYGTYSAVKSVKLTYSKPTYSVYVPTSINKSKGTIVISITNNSKSDNAYFDGYFAIEEHTGENARIHNASILRYEKPDKGLSGTLKKGSRLILRPGEKARFTCKLDSLWDYDREKVQVTTVIRYKQKDFVGVYSRETGNKVYTPEDYYEQID